ncbi:MAG: glycerophosphodiester phosphodiesterase [Proteobacteria bacterium]|nr:glycerophosphodiester phosphodiesterase [Pseudomonadota bacterium]
MSAAREPIVIAHRGACGYLPEHTLEAKALAIGLGADFIEQDVVITRDGVPIVTHDIFLEDVTDVAARFPGRARADGHYYAIDFTLEEIRALRRFERVDDQGHVVFPRRFPSTQVHFGVNTLGEEIEFLQGINRSLNREAGLYTEVKYPAWHRRQGQDISRIVLDTLSKYGYRDADSNVYFQCFDALESRRVRHELGSRLKLIQLVGENAWKESSTDYDALRSDAGLDEVADFAQGIGPEISQLVRWDETGRPGSTGLAARARARGLKIHPYTHRVDALPPSAPDSDAVLRALFDEERVDGVFSDFTDVVVRFLSKTPASTPTTPASQSECR